jgi:hypothetical protein
LSEQVVKQLIEFRTWNLPTEFAQPEVAGEALGGDLVAPATSLGDR